MAKHDKSILKYLAKNAERAPTITEMAGRLGINIVETSATLDSLLAQGLVGKRLNAQGIECWYPSVPGAAPSLSAGASSGSPGASFPRVDDPTPVLPMQLVHPTPAGGAFPAFVPQRSGVGFFTFLIGMLVAAAGGAWVGGKILAREELKTATKGLVERRAFLEAIDSWTHFEAQTKTHVKALETKVQDLTKALDSVSALAKAPEAPAAEAKPAPRTRRR